MAVPTILPQAAPAPARTQPIYDEITELAHDLMADEPGMQLFEATTQAVYMLDELDGYAAAWDSLAFCAGNHNAMQF
jgi:hypothetical protein